MVSRLEAIGVDLGGTKIEVGRVDESGQLLEHRRLITNVRGGPAVITEDIIRTILELINSAKAPIAGIGIGVAGQIDASTGVVHFAPNLPRWHDVPLQQEIEKALHLPVKVVNDVRAITWGEWLFGAGKGCQDMICLFVGTGIGSGIVSNGQLLEGYSNTWGEVGHMTIDLHGPVCTCGNIGCWEAIAGGWGIAQRAREAVLIDSGKGAFLLQLANNQVENISAKTVVEAYRMHDPLAISLINKVKEALAAGCVSLINLFNPARLVLGGGVIDGLPELVPFIEQEIKSRALKAATKNLEVIPAQLGKQVGVIGAAAVVLGMKAIK